jgi:hypothetical protein
MLIAKLRINLKDCGIQYNNSAELETDKTRGTVLKDGKIVRGLGTHFASAEAKERFDKLTAEANGIRAKFGLRFMRGPLESTFFVSVLGEGKAYATQFNTSPDIEVSVVEYNLNSASGDLDEKDMKEWSERVKAQLKRVPLGRSEEADEEGLSALETLATCPILAKETKDRIQLMVAEVRVGKMTRTDLKRGIALLDVTMDQSSLLAPRGRPEAVV